MVVATDSHGQLGKILFTGGCHVVGNTLGEEHSFPRMSQQILEGEGVRAEVEVLPYLKLPHRRRLMQSCKEVRPDVLVLQLGHAELNRQLTAYLRRTCGAPQHRGEPDVIPKLVRSPFQFYAKSVFKKLVDCSLRHPLVDFLQIEKLWRALLTEIRAQRVPRVVMLSPLPCADLTAMYYRRRALPLFQRLATEYGCEFVDVLTGGPSGWQKRFGTDAYYHDGIHLGAGGHQVLAHQITSHLLQAVLTAS